MARTVSAGNVAAAGTLNQDVRPGNRSEFLTVIGVVGTAANAATAAGDVSVQVFPYLDDETSSAAGPTLAPLALPTVDTVAAVLSASRAYILTRYRVAGIAKVQVQVKNNNVAAKPVDVTYDTGP